MTTANMPCEKALLPLTITDKYFAVIVVTKPEISSIENLAVSAYSGIDSDRHCH